ncbi:811_t:CDS:2, partial [Cetraspora pellucida]
MLLNENGPTQFELDIATSDINTESRSLTSITTNGNTSTSMSFLSNQHSKLFSKGLFIEREFLPEHPKALTHREILCFSCTKVWHRKIGDSNTTNLWHHIKNHHPDLDSRKPDKLDNIIEFTPANFRKLLIRWIVLDNQPFTTCENKSFQQMIRLLNPHALISTGDTIKNNIIKCFKEEHINIMHLYQDIPGKISFALNSWTSTNVYSFLAITGHWITKDWVLQNSLLDFMNILGPHSGENLCDAFIKSCNELGILSKLFVITSDNATNNNTLMKYLQDICRNILKCLKADNVQAENDILNNISSPVTAGEIIPKLCKLVVKICSSPQHRERFLCQAQVAALEMREALNAVASIDKELQPLKLNHYEATQLISSAKYPLLASIMPIYNYLIEELETYYNNSGLSYKIATAVNAGLKKLKIYYSKTNNSDMYTIAIILDPQLKLNYFEENNWNRIFIDHIKENFLLTYNNYYMLSAYETIEHGQKDCINDDDFDYLLEHIYGKKRKLDWKNEVELYLKAPCATRRQNILQWWKEHKTEYPHLAIMARDYLAITVTSIPVKRIFSE